jgi:gliding motility-associated-like protein
VSGGANGYSYSWSGPNNFTSSFANPTGLAAGNYILFVTDLNGCVTTDSITLNAPSAITSTLNSPVFTGGYNIACNMGTTGSIDAIISQGVSPYTYAWNGPAGFNSANEDLLNLAAGLYTLNITDANGCEYTSSINLAEPTPINYALDVTPAVCGGANGTINLITSGGTPIYTYSWSNGSMNQVLNNVTPGSYSVSITDGNGCNVVANANVNDISNMMTSGNIKNATCFNDSTGSVDLSVENGNEPLIYEWSNGAVSEDISGLMAGLYTVKVTDNMGCVQRDTFNITQPEKLQLTLSPTIYTGGYNVSSFNGNDGGVTIAAVGGNQPYVYKWSNGSDGETVTGLTAGSYTVECNAGGCREKATINLNEPLDLEMPTGFSPNGNGQNDYFVVHGLEAYPNNDLKIFNRWGNIVYNAMSYSNHWDGVNNNGEALPDGTYFVILTINNGDKVLTGYVDLRR